MKKKSYIANGERCAKINKRKKFKDANEKVLQLSYIK